MSGGGGSGGAGDWHAKLQEHFLEEKHTDVTIRLRIAGNGEQAEPEPATKRRRVKKQQPPPPVDIKAHAVVLCARSRYFDVCLSGDWAEANDRCIELVVESREEAEDVRLLIKQAYAESFTHDEGQLLPLETRLRLAARADVLEFAAAVDELVASLPEGLDYAGALACLDGLPPALEQHPGMAAVREAAVALLIPELGPVADMFEATEELLGGCLPLREEVKELPFGVIKWVLAADALDTLQSENDTYALLKAWLWQSPHVKGDEERRACFTELVPLLRYHHMTADFLSNVVSRCPLIKASGLMVPVLRSALAQREASQTLLEKEKVTQGGRDRGVPPAEARWELAASFTLEEVKALEPGMDVTKWCGVVAGYPAALELKRDEEGETLGASLVFHWLFNLTSLEGGPTAGVVFNMAIRLPPTFHHSDSVFWDAARNCWGFPNPFGKPWAETVREGSPHFPDGVLDFKVAVKLAV